MSKQKFPTGDGLMAHATDVKEGDEAEKLTEPVDDSEREELSPAEEVTEEIRQVAKELDLTPDEISMIQRLRAGKDVEAASGGELKIDEDGFVQTVEQQKIYGPFRDYMLVTTPHGNFGLPAAHIMWFEPKRVWNHKHRYFEVLPKPVYKQVKVREIRTRPLITENGVDMEVQRALLEIREQRARAEEQMQAAGLAVLQSEDREPADYEVPA